MSKIIEAIVCIIAAIAMMAVVNTDRSSGQEVPPPNIGEPLVTVMEPDGTPCTEDEPCWDCATMGNLICGPAPVTANPEFTG